MSDLIKKIKIKKQDGTYTDYIPIGAEAKNVDCSDGESVEYKLNKKPYYYNSVADMKADTNLKVGDMAITLGYYEPNDGGGAEYRIIKGTYIDDGGNHHKLENNLYAELIVKDNEISIKQFGAYGDGEHDDTDAFQIFATSNIKRVIIPDGHYNLTYNLDLYSKEMIGIGNPSLDYISQATRREHFINIFNYFYIENITFNQLIHYTDVVGVFNCSYSTFKNCKFIADGYACGSELDLYTNNHDILIDNCYFKLISVNESGANQAGGI